LVVEATLEEHVSKITEVIQGFHSRIGELEVHITLGTPLDKKEQRQKITITSVVGIKSMEEDCVKLCEESMLI